MLGENTLICGCVGLRDAGKWVCPQGHEFIEAWMAGELTRTQMRSRMKAAQREREHLT